MNKAAGWIDYRARMGKVIAYVHEHLDETLDLHLLADVAHLSPCHWHRVYQALYGETLAATVRRLRLQRASDLLLNSDQSVTVIARLSGYPNGQSFARSFRSLYGSSPTLFRQQGQQRAAAFAQPGATQDIPDGYHVEIRHVPRVHVAGLAHRGSYMGIAKAFETSFVQLAALGQAAPSARWLAEYQDDPFAVPTAQLRSRAGLSVDAAWLVPAPLISFALGGCTCAVLQHRGPYATMRAAYHWLFGHWLVNSGLRAGESPVFEEYLNNPRDTAPADLLTDVYLPLTLPTS